MIHDMGASLTLRRVVCAAPNSAGGAALGGDAIVAGVLVPVALAPILPLSLLRQRPGGGGLHALDVDSKSPPPARLASARRRVEGLGHAGVERRGATRKK